MIRDSRAGRVYAAEFDDDLFDRVARVLEGVEVIETLSIKRPNWISSFDRTGVWVETERSRGRGSGPQRVPAWMFVVAWDLLCKNGSLSQIELLNDLNVKRSAFVCALLAQFSDVVVLQNRPTILEKISQS